MKKILFTVTTLFSFTVFVNAQNSSPYWSLSGNSNVSPNSRFGTTNDISLRFYTRNIQRMIINSSAGLVGIGVSSPTDRLHINTASGSNAFRAQVNGSTKLLVHSGGGVSVGSPSAPPSNGLYVSGNAGIGTTSPSAKLHVTTTSGIGTYTAGGDYGLSAYASSSDGYGVYGSSAYTGVYGYSTGKGYGTYGKSGYIGAFGSGESYGTYGATYSGTGATGHSYLGRGVNGYSFAGTGVRGYSNSSSGGDFESFDGYGLQARTTNGDYAGVFYGDMYSSGTLYQASDKNLKSNIEDLGDAMSIINKLKPKNYEFKKDAKYVSLNLPKGNHYGLLAQDVQEVLPNIVSENSHELRTAKPETAIRPSADGKPAPAIMQQKETTESINIKAVNYIELIPIMVKAMQEQQATIEKQNAKIEALTVLVNKLSLNPNTSPSVKLTDASLGQSTPNPNSTSTRISYNIPTDFSRAELVINNSAGQKVKQIQLTKSGLIDLDTSSLSAGTYFYTLFVNGKSIDTKKMIVNR